MSVGQFVDSIQTGRLEEFGKVGVDGIHFIFYFRGDTSTKYEQPTTVKTILN